MSAVDARQQLLAALSPVKPLPPSLPDSTWVDPKWASGPYSCTAEEGSVLAVELAVRSAGEAV